MDVLRASKGRVAPGMNDGTFEEVLRSSESGRAGRLGSHHVSLRIRTMRYVAAYAGRILLRWAGARDALVVISQVISQGNIDEWKVCTSSLNLIVATSPLPKKYISNPATYLWGDVFSAEQYIVSSSS